MNTDHCQINVDIYNQYVREYIDRFMDLQLYKHTFDHLLERLVPDAAVLELGCGPGNVIRYLKTKRPDLQIVGIDLAPEMIKAASIANPDSVFQLMDIRQAAALEGNFDAVIAAFTIPYLSPSDLPDLFQQMKRLTSAKKGLLYVSCMEGSPEKSGFEKTSFTGASEMYIQYYTRHEIESLITRQDFTITQRFLIDYPESDGSFTTELVYIAKSVDA